MVSTEGRVWKRGKEREEAIKVEENANVVSTIGWKTMVVIKENIARLLTI